MTDVPTDLSADKATDKTSDDDLAHVVTGHPAGGVVQNDTVGTVDASVPKQISAMNDSLAIEKYETRDELDVEDVAHDITKLAISRATGSRSTNSSVTVANEHDDHDAGNIQTPQEMYVDEINDQPEFDLCAEQTTSQTVDKPLDVTDSDVESSGASGSVGLMSDSEENMLSVEQDEKSESISEIEVLQKQSDSSRTSVRNIRDRFESGFQSSKGQDQCRTATNDRATYIRSFSREETKNLRAMFESPEKQASMSSSDGGRKMSDGNNSRAHELRLADSPTNSALEKTIKYATPADAGVITAEMNENAPDNCRTKLGPIDESDAKWTVGSSTSDDQTVTVELSDVKTSGQPENSNGGGTARAVIDTQSSFDETGALLSLTTPTSPGTYEKQIPANYDRAPLINLRSVLMHKRLGGGAEGTVHVSSWKRTIDETLTVAAKVIICQHKKDVDKHLVVIDLMHKLKHTNIVTFYGHNVCESNDHITREQRITVIKLMELADYGSLHSYLSKRYKLDTLTALRWMEEIISAIAFLHQSSEHRILHRDLKADNILLCANKVCKLADFGTMRELVKTDVQTFLGTPNWMAPEIIRNELSNHMCDIYSYAMIMYEIITGHIPFHNYATRESIIFAVGHNKARPSLDDCIHRSIHQLIEGAWEERPSKRSEANMIKEKLQGMRKSSELIAATDQYLAKLYTEESQQNDYTQCAMAQQTCSMGYSSQEPAGCFSTRFSASPTTSNQSSLGRHELSSSQPSSLRTDQGGNTQSYPESGVESIDDLCIVIKNASIHVRQACSHEQTDVDVLVTDTDPGLKRCGGMEDGQIHKKAGARELRKALAAYRNRTDQAGNKAGDLERGQVLKTGSYKLNAFKSIFHTAGPSADEETFVVEPDEEQTAILESCYMNALTLAATNKYTSLVFPCIATADFAYPHAKAAKLAIDTCVKWLEVYAEYRSVKRIVICCAEESDYEQYQLVCAKIKES